MEKLLDKINKNIKIAMKEKNADVLSALRMLLASLKNKKIDLKQDDDLSDEQVIVVVRSEVKKRKDAIEAFMAGNRKDLADKEKVEIKILEQYLPAQLSTTEIKTVIEKVITDLNLRESADFGKIMGVAMAKLKGQADGNQVSAIVKEILNS